jgi:hypothetical protein
MSRHGEPDMWSVKNPKLNLYLGFLGPATVVGLFNG